MSVNMGLSQPSSHCSEAESGVSRGRVCQMRGNSTNKSSRFKQCSDRRDLAAQSGQGRGQEDDGGAREPEGGLGRRQRQSLALQQ